MTLPPRYSPAEHEPRIWKRWIEHPSRPFHADPSRVDRAAAPNHEPGRKRPPYSIVIPPPNVTGRLHLGHALNNTLQDILIRAHRMMGFETLWMPGTDHAGIATQAVVEKRLRAEGKLTGPLRDAMTREEFIAQVQAWKDEYEAAITDQLKRMGCSCDYDRQRFTMDEVCARAVREAFFRLFRDGLIYRGKRLVNWDPELQTAVADDETEMEEVDGFFYYLRYPLVRTVPGEDAQPVSWLELARLGYPGAEDHPPEQQAWVTVATTRPETYLGDTAVAVNPHDPRAMALEGLHVELPLVGRVIPVIRDSYVVMPAAADSAPSASSATSASSAFSPQPGGMGVSPVSPQPLPSPSDTGDPKARYATGFLKVTPAHDPNDYEIGRRHNLPQINIMSPDGRISDQHGWSDVGDAKIFLGLKLSTKEAHQKVIAEFKARGLFEKQAPYRHAVAHSQRSGVPIEPYLSDQWYCKVTDERMAAAANAALASSSAAQPPASGGPALRAGSTQPPASGGPAHCAGSTQPPASGGPALRAGSTQPPASGGPALRAGSTQPTGSTQHTVRAGTPNPPSASWSDLESKSRDTFIDARRLPALAPEGFIPRDPYPPGARSPTDLRGHSRDLPHVELAGATYFVTWRLAKGKPILTDAERDRVVQALRYWDGRTSRVYAAVVMPDHVHALVKPTGDQSVSAWCASVKKFSAGEINKARGGDGPLWQDEQFDHIIRDSDSFAEQLRYIVWNPVEAGLAASPTKYRHTFVHPSVLDAIARRLAEPARRALELREQQTALRADPARSAGPSPSDPAQSAGPPPSDPAQSAGPPPSDPAQSAGPHEDGSSSRPGTECRATTDPTGTQCQIASGNKLTFHPARYARTYESWHDNIRDWCISRQLWWGHRIPIWTGDVVEAGLSGASNDATPTCPGIRQQLDAWKVEGRIAWRRGRRDLLSTDTVIDRDDDRFVTVCVRSSDDAEVIAFLESARLTQDPDVLDTWFSSALWPMSTMGWPDPDAAAQIEPKNPDFPGLLAAFNPTSVLSTAREIITLWVSRMVMFERYLMPDGWPDSVSPGSSSPCGGPALRAGSTEPPATSVSTSCSSRSSSSRTSSEPDSALRAETRHGVPGHLDGSGRGRGPVPFRHVFIHSVIQDGEGRKMSKSLGNGVDPIDIIDAYGADAMRFVLCHMTTQTQDVRMPVERDPATGKNLSPKFDLGRNFCTKLWNASRFAMMNLTAAAGIGDPSAPSPMPHGKGRGEGSASRSGSALVFSSSPSSSASRHLADRWILSRLARTISAANESIAGYEFSVYAQHLYDILWRDFCDWYLEAIKPTVKTDPGQQAVLRAALDTILRLLHPVAPFVTEAIYESLRAIPAMQIPGLMLPDSELLCTAPWPSADPALIDEHAEAEFTFLQELTDAVRTARAAKGVEQKRKITLHLDAALGERLAKTGGAPVVELLAGLDRITSDAPPADRAMFTFRAKECALSNLAEALDAGAERAALEALAAKLDKEITNLAGRLNNPGYLQKAPAKLVEESRAQLAQKEAERDAAHRRLKELA